MADKIPLNADAAWSFAHNLAKDATWTPGLRDIFEYRDLGIKDGTRGDQMVTVQIDLPADGSELAEELKRRLDGWHDTRNPRAKLGI